MVDTPPFLTGRLLLAMPGMGDPRFERAVIFMVAHDEEGAFGIGIGHRHRGMGLGDLLAQLDLDATTAPDAPVLIGGPVDPGRGFVLHSDDWGGQDSVDIDGHCQLTVTQDVLKAIGEGRGPSRYCIALGYAGWSAGQLDAEMTQHGWFAAPVSDAILYDTAPEDRWERAYRAIGIDPALLSAEGGAA